MSDDQDGCEWVSVLFWYRPTRVVPDQGPLNGCVCVFYYFEADHPLIKHCSAFSYSEVLVSSYYQKPTMFYQPYLTFSSRHSLRKA